MVTFVLKNDAGNMPKYYDAEDSDKYTYDVSTATVFRLEYLQAWAGKARKQGGRFTVSPPLPDLDGPWKMTAVSVNLKE